MRKTTIYLPNDLKSQLERIAAETGRCEAEIIRDGIRLVVERHLPPPPPVPIFVSDDPHFAEHVHDHIAGFGER